jgi:hypothetical protein
VVKKANKLNHTHEKIFIPFIAISNRYIIFLWRKKAIDETPAIAVK